MCLVPGPGVPHSIWSWRYGSDPFMPTVPTSWQKQNAEKVDEDEGRERGGGEEERYLCQNLGGEQRKVECETLQISSNYNFELHALNERHGSLPSLPCRCPPKPSTRLDNDIVASHLRQIKKR